MEYGQHLNHQISSIEAMLKQKLFCQQKIMAVISKELGQLSGCWVLEMDMIGLAMEKLIFMKFSMGNHPFIWPYILPIIGELTLRNHQTIHLMQMQISPRLILEICLYYACILNQSLFCLTEPFDQWLRMEHSRWYWPN